MCLGEPNINLYAPFLCTTEFNIYTYILGGIKLDQCHTWILLHRLIFFLSSRYLYYKTHGWISYYRLYHLCKFLHKYKII